MTIKTTNAKVFIINGDPVTSKSQKALLEMFDHEVELRPVKVLPLRQMFNVDDIVIMDIGMDSLQNFSVLDDLLKAQGCPKILVTTFESQVLEEGDQLAKTQSRILFKPFTPNDFVAAVQSLSCL